MNILGLPSYIILWHFHPSKVVKIIEGISIFNHHAYNLDSCHSVIGNTLLGLLGKYILHKKKHEIIKQKVLSRECI